MKNYTKMRTNYDYLKILDNFFNFIIVKFKPLTVHAEAVMVDEVWEEVKKKSLNNEILKWYIMTPVNYDYFKVHFNIKQSKKEVSKILAKRYRWMLEHGQKLELHIHLSIIENMPLEEQEKMFNEAIGWIKKELGISVEEFVPGWWAYNKETVKLCKKLGLKIINFSDYNSTHDYHWVLNCRKND
jgi:peptidoglycan/xylan/chitin deacetylase (PgdA/CDA1 family)